MRPNLHAGPNANGFEPRWHVGAEGEESSDLDGVIVLDPAGFAPGTKVLVQEPECPQCNEVRIAYTISNKPIWKDKCACGFNWKAWVDGEYS